MLVNDGISEEGVGLRQQEAKFDKVTERYLKTISLSGMITAQPMIMIARFLFPLQECTTTWRALSRWQQSK